MTNRTRRNVVILWMLIIIMTLVVAVIFSGDMSSNNAITVGAVLGFQMAVCVTIIITDEP